MDGRFLCFWKSTARHGDPVPSHLQRILLITASASNFKVTMDTQMHCCVSPLPPPERLNPTSFQ